MKMLRTLLLPLLAAACWQAHAGQPAGAECLVPSKPGGAMDLTCKLAQHALPGEPGAPALRLSYMPGGVGAVAWHTLVSQRRNEPNTLVAFSGGSVLNLARGKFGKASADDVRWVAAFAHMETRPDFARMRQEAGLYPFSLTGEALTRYVKQSIADYNRRAVQFKLVRER